MVITSTRLEASPQANGWLAVRELHVADGGEKDERSYMAPPDADLDAELAANGRLFLERLAAGGK